MKVREAVRVDVPLLDYVRYEDAPERVAEALAGSAYADAEDRHLFYELVSNAPHLVPSRAEYFRQLMAEGVLDRREKELAYLTVALVEDAAFVAATHARYLVDDHGVPEATVTALARGDPSGLDERDRAVVDFTRSVTRTPDDVSVADVDALREGGFDDAGVMELLLLVCAARTATTITVAMDVELDDRGEAPPPYLPAAFDL